MSWQVGIAAIMGLTLLAACSNDPMSQSATDRAAALDGCKAEAEAAKAQPEGRGFAGDADYNKFVDECMRSKGY